MIVAAIEELFRPSMPTEAPDLAGALANIEADVNALRETRDKLVYNDAVVDRLGQLQANLTRLRAVLDELQQIDPQVIATPFRTEVESVRGADLDIVDFYVPSVIALLLQHLCVTFGALTIVMEREAGTFELFQASPLSAIEVLLGKYLSYLLFSAVLAATLTGLLAIGLTVPMRGSWFHYAVTIGALLFASLSIGFVLSLVAQTTTQAVQYSMIVLLSSVFFTGFFLNL
jgi:ABC-2 type transport system permease protein